MRPSTWDDLPRGVRKEERQEAITGLEGQSWDRPESLCVLSKEEVGDLLCSLSSAVWGAGWRHVAREECR